jgi:hypothetical protein
MTVHKCYRKPEFVKIEKNGSNPSDRWQMSILRNKKVVRRFKILNCPFCDNLE